VAKRAALAIFQGVIDQALIASGNYPQSLRNGPLYQPFIEQASPTILPNRRDESKWDVKLGVHSLGMPASREQADHLASIVGGAVKQLRAGVKPVVEMYSHLVEKRDQLREQLAPMAVQKWAVDGSCSMCPTSESDQP